MIAQHGINHNVHIPPNLGLAAKHIVVNPLTAMPGHIAAQQDGIGLFRRNLVHQPAPHLGIRGFNFRRIGKAHVAISDDPQRVGELAIASLEVRACEKRRSG